MPKVEDEVNIELTPFASKTLSKPSQRGQAHSLSEIPFKNPLNLGS